MRIINFARRNFKELLRDPVSLIFLFAMPLFFLIIFQQFHIPSEEYKLVNFAPSIVIFSYAFISLFTAQLVSKDRSSSLLSRLFSSPMKSYEYIFGYSLALLPIAIFQNILFFITAVILGLEISINIIYTILILIPISILFIGLGILIGSITSEKQAPALCSLVVQLVAFTSGMWFNINEVGKVFKWVCKILPFNYSVQIPRRVLTGNYNDFWLSILILVAYTILIFITGSFVFKRKMTSDNK